MNFFSRLTVAILFALAGLSLGCSVEQRLSYCVLALQVPTHSKDSPDGVMTGTAVCATMDSGERVVLTARHIAFAGKNPGEISFARFNASGSFYDWEAMSQYAGTVTDVPGKDLAIIHLRLPIDGVGYAQIADRVVAPMKVVAFGFGSHDSNHAGRILRGTIDDVSIRGDVLAATLGSGNGDSGGPVFDPSSEKLLGIMHSHLLYPGGLQSPFQIGMSGVSDLRNLCDAAGVQLPSDTFAISLTNEDIGIPQSSAGRRYADFIRRHFDDPGIYEYNPSMKPEASLVAYTQIIQGSNVPPEIVAEATCDRACVYILTNKPAEAIADLNQLLTNKTTPAHCLPYGLYNRAFAYQQENKLDSALADFTRAIDAPGASANIIADSLFNRAAIYHRRGEFEKETADKIRGATYRMDEPVIIRGNAINHSEAAP